MSMNRAMRRAQAREDRKDFYKMDVHDRQAALCKNGITAADLKKSYDEGREDGINSAVMGTMTDMYAAVLLAMLDNGNCRGQAVSFLNDVGEMLATKIASFDFADRLLDEYGIKVDWEDTIHPIVCDPDWHEDMMTFWDFANQRYADGVSHKFKSCFDVIAEDKCFPKDSRACTDLKKYCEGKYRYKEHMTTVKQMLAFYAKYLRKGMFKVIEKN